MTKEEQKAILNYGELFLCLFFQTLPETKTVRYLPEDAVRTSIIGLNSQNPMGQEIRDLMFQPGSSKWASIDVPQVFRDKRQNNMDGIRYKSWNVSMRLFQGTYRWARDPEPVLRDDPHMMVRCGRCRGIVGQDRVPLYARDGPGYIVRRFVCKECRNSDICTAENGKASPDPEEEFSFAKWLSLFQRRPASNAMFVCDATWSVQVKFQTLWNFLPLQQHYLPFHI